MALVAVLRPGAILKFQPRRSSALQSTLAQAPAQRNNPVFTEERLAFKYEGRHAPVARCAQRLLIGLHNAAMLGRAGNRLFHRCQIKARARSGFSEMAAFVPATRAAEDQAEVSRGCGKRI